MGAKRCEFNNKMNSFMKIIPDVRHLTFHTFLFFIFLSPNKTIRIAYYNSGYSRYSIHSAFIKL